MVLGRHRAVAAAVAAGISVTALVAVQGPTGAARADVTTAAVRVPRQLEDVVRADRLTGQGGTVVVRQPVDNRSRWLTGSSGTMRPLPLPADAEFVTATRRTVWFTTFSGEEPNPFVATVSAYDLASGRTVSSVLPQGEQFLTAGDAVRVSVDIGRGSLLAVRGSTRTVLGDGSVVTVEDGATAGDALVVRGVFAGRGGSVALFDLRSGAVQHLAAVTVRVEDEVATDGRTVAWTDGAQVFHRAVAGGPVRRVPGADFGAHLFVLDRAVGWVDPDGGLRLAALDGGAPVTAALDGVTGAVGAGTTARALVGGDPAVAGIYRVRADGTAARIARIDRVRAVTADVDLAAGRLYSADFSDSSVAGTKRIRVRDVLGGTVPTLGAASVLDAGARRGTGVTFSADRGLVREPAPGAPFRFLDGGVPGALVTPTIAQTPQLSGPYAFFTGRVFRADGAPVGVRYSQQRRGGALFGSRLVTGDTRTGQVWVYDLTRPVTTGPVTRTTNPSLLRGTRCTTGEPGACTVTVATGGDVVAWADVVTTGRGRLVLHDLRTGRRTRQAYAGWVETLVADTGVVAYVRRDDASSAGGEELRLVDPSNPTAPPVVLSRGEDVVQVAVDGGLVAWRTGSGDAYVARVPFDRPQRPRLLGALGTGFSPDGDGDRDVWRPEFDLTEQVTGAVLTVRRGSTVLWRTPVTARLGSIRGIRWDGRDSDGEPVPDGRYTWTLTGAAADGGGPVAALDGVSAATGTVVVDRVAPVARRSTPSPRR